MAKGADQTLSVIKGVNLLLFTAWEHGARHMALRPKDHGTEVSFLGEDGNEHIEQWPMPYEQAVNRLRSMSAGVGCVRVNVADQHWKFDVVFPDPRRPQPVFLHLRPSEE